MKQDRVGRGVMCGLLVAVIAVAVGGCWRDGTASTKKFPGAFPGSRTEMSSRQAFRYAGIRPPSSMEGLRYYAMVGTDGFLMVAMFKTGCDAIPEFVTRNAFRKLPDVNSDTINVKISAKQKGGWSSAAGDDWYLRDEKGASMRTEMLIHHAGTDCTVYLDV